MSRNAEVGRHSDTETRSSTSPRLGIALAAALILLLAAFLRFWNLGSVSFTYDAAAASSLAAEWVDKGIFPVHGMVSSVGIQNPPAFIWILALPVLFTRDPALIVAVIALLNVLAVWGCYRLGRRYWAVGVGLAAALLFAASPWAVQRARGIIAQDLLAPGAVLFMSFLYAWIVEGRRWGLAAGLITLTVLTQLHFAALALAPLLAIVLLGQAIRLGRRRKLGELWAPLATGIAVSLALYAPYFTWDAASGWENAGRLIGMLSAPSTWHPEAIDFALMNIGGRNIHSLSGEQRFREFLSGLPGLAYWPDRIEELLVVLAAAYMLVRLWLRRRDAHVVQRDGLVLLWLTVPVLFFLRSKSDVAPHYLGLLYPAQYLVLAATFADILAVLAPRPKLRSSLRGLMAVGLAVLVVWQAYLSVSIYRFVDTHDTPGGWGTPARILTAVANQMDRLAEGSGFRETVMLCEGSEPRWDECPAVWQFLTSRAPVPLKFTDYNDPLLWSHQDDEGTLLVLAPGESRAASEVPRFAQELPQARIPLRENAGAYRFFDVHDFYRDLDALLATMAQPDDAIILNVGGERDRFERAYTGSLPVYEVPQQGVTREQTVAHLQELLTRHRRIYGIYRAPEANDPEAIVDGWLTGNTYRSADQWFGPVNFVTYAAPDTGRNWSTAKVGAVFDDQLQLQTYAATPDPVPAGDMLQLRLNWQVLKERVTDVVCFAQLLDQENHILAQRDLPLVAAGSPISSRPEGRPVEWPVGEEITSLLGMTIPANTPPGDHRLIIGLYDAQTGQRLRTGSGDYVDLGTVRVAAAPQ